jgi:hypothetical protein
MATTYTAEYNNAFVAVPPAHNYAYGAAIRYFPFNQVRTASGTANDLVYVAKLPPQALLDMLLSWVSFKAATATETLDLGWDAYRDMDGTLQAASAGGLLSAILMTTDGVWRGGALITGAAIAQSLPVVYTKAFNNRDPVLIYATLKVANPGSDDELHGALAVITP